MKSEIESLNLGGFDIEELEHRVELGQIIPIVDGPDEDVECGTFHCDNYRRF
jgi:hypothetical protein